MEDLSMFEIDEEQLNARLGAMQAMMGEMGWRWFMAEINQEVESIDVLLHTVSTEIDLGRIQGRRDAFIQILSFEDTVDNMLNREIDDADV
jgi:hypothetical protein